MDEQDTAISAEKFSELLMESYFGMDSEFINHLSMFLGNNREAFLDFIGVEF